MADLKGTKTEENLKAALAGESQARVKYEFYASQAKKDGYVEIKDIFQESSNLQKPQEKKDSMTLQIYLMQQVLLKRYTKTDTMLYLLR